MKSVFVIGDYYSKSNYKNYIKIIRKLQKNYNVISMLDNVDGKEKFKYYIRDMDTIKDVDYIVVYLPSSLAPVDAVFLIGWARALEKKILVIASKYCKETILNYMTVVVYYVDSIANKSNLIIEDYI